MTTPMGEPVAIVGMSGRFPGAGSIDALWELLNSCGDAIRPVPPERWDTSVPLDPEKPIPSMGGFLDGVDEFDAGFFGVSPREAAEMDPQQRLMLEMAWRALEDGRVQPDRVRGTRAGVYVGASWHDYETLRQRRGLGAGPHSLVGTQLDVIASRLSYTLGLTGPSMTVETGCSSALVGLDLAVRAIRSGDVDSALVGGVNLLLTPDVSIGFTHFGGLTQDGRCAAFGAGASGFVRGEGVIALYLKPLRAARRDGDRVRAVIVETVVNNDGGGESLVTPSLDGQRDLLRRAYLRTAVDVGRLAYVEAHGTGTRRGDPIEARALGEILGSAREPADGPLLIGSVKSNIGHLEAAAGIAGLVKAVLCLEHGTVPPSLHSEVPNPDIAFDALNVRIVHEHSALPVDGTALIGVNSFGWGGTNAHVVLRRSDADVAPPMATALPRSPGFVPISAHNGDALRLRCGDIADLVADAPTRLAEISAALARRAPTLPLRCAILAAEPGEVMAELRAHAVDAERESPAILSGRARTADRTAFVFPGQGSQWHGLAAVLYEHDPVFAETVDACARALKPHVDWDAVAVLSGASGPGWLERVDEVQPVLWALSVAIATSWQRAGIVPDVVIGHSQGEIAAATVAGLLSLDDAALIVARRSALLRSVAGTGRMLSVELSAAEVPGAIAGFEGLVALAVHNGPTSCVLSGDADAIEALGEVLTAGGVFCRMVNVDYASHSPLMTRVRDPLRAELTGVAPLAGAVEMMSTVRVGTVTAVDLTGDYWVENLCRPVLFADAMAELFDSGVTHVVEISPHPVLLPAVEQQAAERPDPPVVLPSFYRDCDPVAELNRSRARAFVSGLRPFGAVADSAIELPPYPLQARAYWLPDIASGSEVGTGTLRVPVYPSSIEPGAWQASIPIGLRAMPWLTDHRVGDAVVIPGAMQAALAIAVVRTRFGVLPAQLSGLRFLDVLTIGDDPIRVEVTLRQDLSDEISFEVAALDAGSNSWSLYAHGHARHRAVQLAAPLPFPVDAADVPAPGEVLSIDDFYAHCARRGLNYGPDFRGIRDIRRLRDARGDRVLAEIVLGERARVHVQPGELHATLVDCAMQTALALFDDERAVLPAGIGELLLDGVPSEPVGTAWAYAIRRSDNSADIHLFDTRRAPLARILGLELHAVDDERTEDRAYDREFGFDWSPDERAETDAVPGSFAIIGAGTAVEALSDALRRAGTEVSTPAEPGAAARAGTVVYVAPSEVAGLDAQRRGLVDLAELIGLCARTNSATTRLVVVTSRAQAVDTTESPDPGGAMFWGLVRVARREHPGLSAEIIDLTTLYGDGQERDGEFDDCAAELVAGVGADQVALRSGQRYIGWIAQGRRREPSAARRPWCSAPQPFRLELTPGDEGEVVRFAPLEVRSPARDEVVIEVEASILNSFAAAATAIRAADEPGHDRLVHECAGVIRAIGDEVRDRAVGDRVVACGFGPPASHVTVRADHTQPIPDGMAHTTAAATPMAVATAWYALDALARLAPGETVLIHADPGGVGSAAITIARSTGARIIATAAGADLCDHLRRTHDIEHVFDSRSRTWADKVRAVAGAQGVDVVLNSLTGAAIGAGLDLLAADGRFIELGDAGVREDRRIGVPPLARGIMFAAADLAGLMARRPTRFAAALSTAWQKIWAGGHTAEPVEAHEFDCAAALLPAMRDGASSARVVLTHPGRVTDIGPSPMPQGRFRSDGTYLITGGRGALGQSLAAHLLANGAGAVALVGRGASDAVDSATVRNFRADVADRNTLARVLDSIRSDMPPLRGVFHAAGILDDATILGVDAERFERVLRPKVDGARHLDALTADDPLDLFVLFSSVSALIGNPGQAAYAAANTYLDALAVARRYDGRPGLSIQWGFFADVGLAAAAEHRSARLIEHGISSFSTAEAWAALSTFLAEDRSQVAYASFEPRQWFDAYPDSAAQTSWQMLLRRAAIGTAAGGGEFHAALAGSTADDRRILVRDKIAEVAARVLRMRPADLDAKASFKALGLDSLMSLEMRNRLESVFALRFSTTLLWTYGNAEALAGAIGDQLAESLATVEG
ncbi:SDR family NAD(P)-dependent oxidoreductase [Nocardia sp. NPDC057668]|uniref:type I polyketide synthase n=1 Tax=Nocardia sp. NPDC057668 TaxID=3346202 RepID=UPI0036711E72